MKKIAIDMDDVICGNGFLKLVNQFLNANYTNEDINGYYIQVYILSTYVLRDQPEFSGEFLKYKHEWLYENLPFIDPNHYIFTTNKSLIECDIRIDDKLSNLEGNAEKKILFTSYHNQEYNKEKLEKKNIIRVNSWEEIEKMLLP